MSFFRFRKNKRFVNSTFRGARMDKFPYFLYPTENLIGFWTNERVNQNSIVATNYSDSQNDAVLRTGRAVATDGVNNIIKFPDVGTAVKSLNILCSSATDTTYYATDTATQTEDASGTIVADGTYQTATITFGTAISGEIDLATDGTNYFEGNTARVQAYDASNDLIDEWIAADHNYISLSGLNELLFITQNGKVGTFVFCSSVTLAESPVPQLAGANWNDYVYFNSDVTKEVVFGAVTFTSGKITFDCIINKSQVANKFIIFHQDSTDNSIIIAEDGSSSTDITFGVGSPTIRVDGIIPVDKDDLFDRLADHEVHSVEISNLSISFALNMCGYSNFGFSGFAGSIFNLEFDLTDNGTVDHRYLGYGTNPWADLVGSTNGIQSGSPISWIIKNGSTENIDILGNSFHLSRPTTTAFNIPLSGSVGVTDAVLNSVQTVLFWVYYDGTDKTFIDFNVPDISSSSGSVTSSGITAPTYYVNGAATASLGSPHSYKLIAVTTSTAFSVVPINITGKLMIDKIALYSDQKSSADILSIYDDTKAPYGL